MRQKPPWICFIYFLFQAECKFGWARGTTGANPRREAFERVRAAVMRLATAIKAVDRQWGDRGPFSSWLYEADLPDLPEIPSDDDEPPEAPIVDDDDRPPLTREAIFRVLRHIYLAAHKHAAAPRKSGAPSHLDKLEVIHSALECLEAIRPEQCTPLSARDRDRFVELFFETATGSAIERNDLEWPLRKALKEWKAYREKRKTRPVVSDLF